MRCIHDLFGISRINQVRAAAVLYNIRNNYPVPALAVSVISWAQRLEF
jgi:hypothetical protein